jgi:hypothetical protein
MRNTRNGICIVCRLPVRAGEGQYVRMPDVMRVKYGKVFMKRVWDVRHDNCEMKG